MVPANGRCVYSFVLYKIRSHKKNKIVVSKHLAHFCYPMMPVFHQHLNSDIAYPGVSPENSSHVSRTISALPFVWALVDFTRMGVGRHYWSSLLHQRLAVLVNFIRLQLVIYA